MPKARHAPRFSASPSTRTSAAYRIESNISRPSSITRRATPASCSGTARTFSIGGGARNARSAAGLFAEQVLKSLRHHLLQRFAALVEQLSRLLQDRADIG